MSMCATDSRHLNRPGESSKVCKLADGLVLYWKESSLLSAVDWRVCSSESAAWRSGEALIAVQSRIAFQLFTKLSIQCVHCRNFVSVCSVR